MKGCVTWFVLVVGLILFGTGIIGVLVNLGSLRVVAFALLLVAVGFILLGLGNYLEKRWGIDTHMEGGGE